MCSYVKRNPISDFGKQQEEETDITVLWLKTFGGEVTGISVSADLMWGNRTAGP